MSGEGAKGETYAGKREVTRRASPLLAWRKAVAAAEDLSSTQKLVALVLSLHMNGDGASCFPSQETIAAEASLGIRAVRDALKALDDGGFIRREGGRYRGDVTRYVASLPSERRHVLPPSHGKAATPAAFSEGKAAPDDAEGGISIPKRRHDVPTRTSVGRPEDVPSETGETSDLDAEGVSAAEAAIAELRARNARGCIDLYVQGEFVTSFESPQEAAVEAQPLRAYGLAVEIDDGRF